MSTKIVVTNLARLHQKYGNGGLSRIQDAITRLTGADAARSIETRLIPVDDNTAMQQVNGVAVQKTTDPCQNKMAVDAIWRTWKPDYLVLLGATDVIPHQDLKNPIVGDKDDKDPCVDSDLPYACDSPYSQQSQDFVGPTRVVGRIPDIINAHDPGYLITLLKTASTWRSRDPEDYADHLGISAWVWRNSTSLSLRKIFGCDDGLQISPPKGPRWRRSLISRRFHLVNCHGSLSDPHFYGQRGQHNFPISHTAQWLNDRLSEGTVAAAECCYGATMYDPTGVRNNQMGICSAYLANGAYGFFGSTTIAYGYPIRNGWGDLICQSFLKNVLGGASLGRAVLEARQEYVQSAVDLDPADLKTLAQFNLLGDPSIHPVRLSSPGPDVGTDDGAGGSETRMHIMSYERSTRRSELAEVGTFLKRTRAVAVDPRPMEPGTPVAHEMQRLARRIKLIEPNFLSYSIKRPSDGGRIYIYGQLVQPTAFKVAIGKIGPPVRDLTPLGLVIGIEANGEIVYVKRGFSR